MLTCDSWSACNQRVLSLDCLTFTQPSQILVPTCHTPELRCSRVDDPQLGSPGAGGLNRASGGVRDFRIRAWARILIKVSTQIVSSGTTTRLTPPAGGRFPLTLPLPQSDWEFWRHAQFSPFAVPATPQVCECIP